jgi:FkbM family methyltransferase
MKIVKGFWVNDAEAERLAATPTFEGRLDLDVSKLARALSHCSRFGLAIDVGAHVGGTAAYMARHFERVIAFEAVPETFDLLCRNIPGNVEARNQAVSDTIGEVLFEYNPRFSHLSHRHSGEKTLGKSQTVGPIPTVTIDSLAVDVTFLKVDVEGAEIEVVRGAIETIERSKPLILIEQGGNESKYFGRVRDEAGALLMDLGLIEIPMGWKNDKLFGFAT